MKQRHVNITIQFQKMKTSSVHYMIEPQFNLRLPPRNFTFVNICQLQSLIASIPVCDVFVPARFVAGYCCCIEGYFNASYYTKHRAYSCTTNTQCAEYV